MAPKVEVLIKNAAESVTEGPHWDENNQSLLFVDIDGGNIQRYNPLQKTTEKKHIEGKVNMVVPRKNGGYIVANGLNILQLNWESGLTLDLATVQQPTGSSVNDGKCDAKGRLWLGTFGPRTGFQVIPNAGFLYSMEKDHSLKKHVDKVTLSNGMTWTADNTKMFFIDSTPKTVYSFDFNLTNGTLSNKQPLVQLPKDSAVDPDGMTSDVNDNLWCALFRGSCVAQFDHRTGQEISRVAIPTSQVTSCCWGGKNFDELYVTTGRIGVTDEYAGSVFRVTGLGTRGRPADVYVD